VRHVAISENDLVNLVFPNQRFEFVFATDRDTARVERSCQLGRINPVLDTGNLCCRKGDDFITFIIPVVQIEVVKIAPSGAHDDDFTSLHHELLSPGEEGKPASAVPANSTTAES